MEIHIRSAVGADLPTLKTFEQGIIKAERPYDVTLKPDPISYYDIGEMIASEGAEVVVAEINGTPVASGYVLKKQSLEYAIGHDHAFIGFLYVAPEHRGKGINKKVLARLFDWADRMGLPEVRLTVYPENRPAVRAYEKAGFAPHLLEMRLNLDDRN